MFIDPLTKAILATYDAGTFLRLFSYNQNPQKLDEVFSYKTAQGDKYYPHTDMLGSVYALSDSTGTSQASWTYDVYGTRTQTSGTLIYAFGFTGREHDGDTGLIYSRDRYYDPSVGSWIQADRAGYLSGPNLYQYASDLPTLLTDPSGMLSSNAQAVIALVLIIVAIIAAIALSSEIIGAIALSSLTSGIIDSINTGQTNPGSGAQGFFNGALGGLVGGLLYASGLSLLGPIAGSIITQQANRNSGCPTVQGQGGDLLAAAAGGLLGPSLPT